MPLVERIAAAPHLTPSEKVLARFYEDALPGAALLNLDEVCSATGLSTATVARFARTLGYSGFREMSRELHADLRTGIAHPVDRLRPGDGHGPSPLTTRFEHARADLESSAASLDPQVFEHVADLLSDAGRPLYLGAVASGRPLLEHFAMLAEYLRGGITVLGGTDRWAHAMSGMSADAVVLATAFDRAPVSIKALLDFAGGARRDHDPADQPASDASGGERGHPPRDLQQPERGVPVAHRAPGDPRGPSGCDGRTVSLSTGTGQGHRACLLPPTRLPRALTRQGLSCPPGKSSPD